MNQKLQVINPMKMLFYSLALVLLFFSTKSIGQTFSGTYSFAGATGNVASLSYNGAAITNLSVNPLVKVGVTTSSNSGNSRATNWSTGSVDLGAIGGNVDLGKYYEFTITANSGFTISNPSIQFGVGRSGAGPRRFQWRTSLDSYATLIPVTTTGAGLTNVSNVLESPDSNSGYTGNVVTVSSTGISSITFRFYAYGAETNAGTGGLQGNLTFNGTLVSNTTPVITGSATASAFTTTYGTASAEQSFSISGIDLTSNITATAPTGFEVSNDGLTYASTATFTQSSGNASGTLRVRLKSDAQVSGSYNSQNIVLSSTGASNVNIETSATGNSVAPAIITISANNQTVSFGTPQATVLSAGTFNSSGFVNGENASVISGSVSYTTNYTDTTAASTSGVTITPDVTLLTALNYIFNVISGNITITSNPVPTITSALTYSSVYGTPSTPYFITASESPTSYSASGLPTGLTLNTLTGEISGTPSASAGSYNVIIFASNAGGDGNSQILVYTITPKELTISGATADNKVYDRTTSATISGSVLNGVYGLDDVSVSNTGTFLSFNVGNAIQVSSTQTLSGTDSSKYSLLLPTGLTANITPKELTVLGATAQNKTFDGNNAATLTGTLDGVISPDAVSLALSGTFASSSIGNNIEVTSTSTIGGANSGNYTLTQPVGLTANITVPVFPLLQWNTFGNSGNEITEATVSNDATMLSSSLNYTGSTVSPTGNSNRFGGTWGNVATVTTDKYIQFTASPALGYIFTPTSFVFIWDRSSTGPSSLVLRSSADNFTSDLGVITGLSSGGSSTTTFRTIDITGLTGLSTATTFRLYGYNSTGGTGGFDCASSLNNVVLNGYTDLAPPPSILTSGVLTALNTVYGTPSSETSFSVSGTYLQSGILVTPPSGFEVSLTPGSGFASSITVGSAGTLSPTTIYVRLSSTANVINSPYSGDIVLTSSNATSVSVATASSSVTAKELTIIGLTANDKVFDGNTVAILSGTASLDGIVNGDEVTLDGTPTATFATSSIGTNILVTVSGYSISGTNVANYFLADLTLFADITSEPSPVVSSLLTANATYGVVASTYTITATNSPTSFDATGLPSGLIVNSTTGEISGTPTALPGNYSVTISATNAGGTGAATLVFTILAKELTVSSAVANDKVYNKNNVAVITGSVLEGIVGADDVSVTTTGVFSSVDVANAIEVTSTQTLSGLDSSKYTLLLPTGLSANITPKGLTLSSALALSKPFDGNTSAVITGNLVGVELGDDVVLVGTGLFASSSVGNNIPVTSTATIVGTSSLNYTLVQPVGLVANITPPALLQWNTFGNAGTEATEPSVYNNPNIVSANLIQSGLTSAGNPNRFGGSGWFNTGNTTGGNTLSEAIAGNDYIEFTVTPQSGYTYTATSLGFIWDFSGTGPKSVALRSSLDGYASNIGMITNMTASTTAFKTISIASLVNVSTATTFRLYGFGASAIGGTGGFDCGSSQSNVILYGTSALLTGPTASVISGSTAICENDNAVISVTIDGGTSPFTLVYTDGTNQYTETGYTSGANILVSPTENTNYTIVSITDAFDFEGTGNSGIAEITIIPNASYYVDADGDGYGDNLAEPLISCNSILGYVTNNLDCNDNVASINPGAVDVCYDGIDNDCNGIIDNVGLPGGCTPIVSTLPAAQCGTTVSGLSTSMYATNISGAQGYRFKVTNMSTIGVQIIDRPVNNLAFSAIPGVTYNTQYQVEIGVKYNNVWQPFYGSPCFITTPNPVSTPGAQCGTTLTAMNQWVYTTYVANVTAYRFKVTNLTTSEEQIFTTSTYKFNFTQLSSRAYNTTYSVEVSLRNTNGVFMPYNAGCNVTTPSFPESSIRDSQCDYTALSTTEMIAAVVVPTATVYRFFIYNNALEYQATVDRTLNTFNLNMFTGLTPGATYSVQVSVKIGEEFGPYGKVCSLTVPGLAKEQTIAKNIVDFKAVAYPNPFAENFKLDVNTSSEEVIKVRVYDMIGKQVEQRQINVSDVASFEVGSGYPSGVYNVIVTQGENTQTLRVIKR